MKVAIVFWGLCRSTEYTIESLQKNLFQVFDSQGIDYKVYLHTWNIFRKYHNPRAGERNIFLKNTTWRYLNPSKYLIENQDEVDPQLHLSKYRKHGDPWQKDEIKEYVKFSCVDNVVRALYSLQRATELWIKDMQSIDVVMYIRPDVKLMGPFHIEWLSHIHDNVVYMPDFHLIDGVNDRFAFGRPATMKIYGLRFKYAQLYSELKPLHSERFLAEYLLKNKLTICLIPFRFRRVRAGGTVYDGDRDI
jgi:hypothetical protein